MDGAEHIEAEIISSSQSLCSGDMCQADCMIRPQNDGQTVEIGIPFLDVMTEIKFTKEAFAQRFPKIAKQKRNG